MNKFIKGKIAFLILFCYLGVGALSLVFGLLIGKESTDGNTVYWVFKGICLGWLLISMLSLLIGKNFGKHIPIFIVGLVIQILPALLRIGWANNKEVQPLLIIIDSVILFIVIAATLLFGIGADLLKHGENKAKPSSNHK